MCTVVSLIRPQNYDWAQMKEIPMVEEDPNAYISDGKVGMPCEWYSVQFGTLLVWFAGHMGSDTGAMHCSATSWCRMQ